MNTQHRHIIAILLIISSIALLLIFQIFWLKKVYDEQTEQLRKEADNIFHKTLATLQDSLIQTTIQPFSPKKDIKMKKLSGSDNPKYIDWRTNTKLMLIDDSTSKDNAINHTIKIDSLKTSQIQVYVGTSPETDSLGKIAGNIVTRVLRTPKTKNFVIQLDKSTLKIKDINPTYRKALQKAQLPINFKVFEFKNTQKRPKIEGLTTNEFHSLPFLSNSSYVAQLSDYQWFVFKKILPQIIFSFILLSITGLAFYWIYRAMRQQQILTELKNDFIRNVTHELKTPITTVSVAIEALQNFNVLENPPLTQEYLEISKNEINRLALLVDKILKTAVFEQKGVDLKAENIDLKALINQILNSLKLQFEKYQALVDFETEGQDFEIKGDMIHLTNVIYNLLDNALKYSPENPIIKVKLQDIDNQVIIKIKDFGIGIDKEHQSKIFDKFFRVPTGDVHNIKGYGLGLSYVKSVILKHQGNILVESEKGKGSQFSINLPKNPIELKSNTSSKLKKSA